MFAVMAYESVLIIKAKYKMYSNYNGLLVLVMQLGIFTVSTYQYTSFPFLWRLLGTRHCAQVWFITVFSVYSFSETPSVIKHSCLLVLFVLMFGI